jgi:hypothetical protein
MKLDWKLTMNQICDRSRRCKTHRSTPCHLHVGRYAMMRGRERHSESSSHAQRTDFLFGRFRGTGCGDGETGLRAAFATHSIELLQRHTPRNEACDFRPQILRRVRIQSCHHHFTTFACPSHAKLRQICWCEPQAKPVKSNRGSACFKQIEPTFEELALINEDKVTLLHALFDFRQRIGRHTVVVFNTVVRDHCIVIITAIQTRSSQRESDEVRGSDTVCLSCI